MVAWAIVQDLWHGFRESETKCSQEIIYGRRESRMSGVEPGVGSRAGIWKQIQDKEEGEREEEQAPWDRMGGGST